MFSGQNHILAIATVIGTMGGFQSQPEWFTKLSKYWVWQILMGAVLVYQGGGGQNIIYSLCISVAFFAIMYLSTKVVITPNSDTPIVPVVSQVSPIASVQSETAIQGESTESYYGY